MKIVTNLLLCFMCITNVFAAESIDYVDDQRETDRSRILVETQRGSMLVQTQRDSMQNLKDESPGIEPRSPKFTESLKNMQIFKHLKK